MFTTYTFSSSLANALSLSLSLWVACGPFRPKLQEQDSIAEGERGREGRRSGGQVEGRQGRL